VGDRAGELISIKIYSYKHFRRKSCKATFTLSLNIFHNKKIVEDVKLKMLAIKTEKDFKRRAEVLWLAMRNEMGSGSEDGFQKGEISFCWDCRRRQSITLLK
jgi:hypothetical protein